MLNEKKACEMSKKPPYILLIPRPSAHNNIYELPPEENCNRSNVIGAVTKANRLL